MSQQATHLRSLYRRLLRELPARKPSLIANPSPLHSRIRSSFSSQSVQAPELASANQPETVDQIIQYLKSQRMYITLVERYNPGMNMDQKERIRLSARRIGMNLPEQAPPMGHGDGSDGAGDGQGEGGAGRQGGA